MGCMPEIFSRLVKCIYDSRYHTKITDLTKNKVSNPFYWQIPGLNHLSMFGSISTFVYAGFPTCGRAEGGGQPKFERGDKKFAGVEKREKLEIQNWPFFTISCDFQLKFNGPPVTLFLTGPPVRGGLFTHCPWRKN